MFEQAWKNIDDVLCKDGGCSSKLDYFVLTSWLLFLKHLVEIKQTPLQKAFGEEW